MTFGFATAGAAFSSAQAAATNRVRLMCRPREGVGVRPSYAALSPAALLLVPGLCPGTHWVPQAPPALT
jgi:hypothetical protein